MTVWTTISSQICSHFIFNYFQNMIFYCILLQTCPVCGTCIQCGVIVDLRICSGAKSSNWQVKRPYGYDIVGRVLMFIIELKYLGYSNAATSLPPHRNGVTAFSKLLHSFFEGVVTREKIFRIYNSLS